MARRVLPVAIGVLGCIWPWSRALACDPDAARGELQAAYNALRDVRPAAFYAAVDRMEPCPDMAAQERAEILRIQGAALAMHDQTADAVRLFQEARALDPQGRLPIAYFSAEHPVSVLFELSAPRLVQAEPLPVPEPTLALSPLPVEPAAPLPTMPPPRREPSRAPLLLGALASSAAAGSLWFAATQMDAQAEEAAANGLGQDAASAWAEQERYRGRQLGFQVAAGGSAALAVGLVGATISLSW